MNTETRPAAFQITERAATRIQNLADGQNKILLVGVKSKGCNGYSYDMRFVSADELPKFSEKVEAHGVSVAIDPKASMFLIGTVMDYLESPLQSGFEFTNPNETGRCGCGESFSVKKD